MASSKEYLEYILEHLSGVEGIACRPMMGEYLLYVHGRLIGGIYDNRLLVKPTAAARALMPDSPEEMPYAGARPMLLVESTENRDFLAALCRALYASVPAPKNQKK